LTPSLSVVIPHWPFDDEIDEALRRCVTSLPSDCEKVVVVNDGTGIDRSAIAAEPVGSLYQTDLVGRVGVHSFQLDRCCNGSIRREVDEGEAVRRRAACRADVATAKGVLKHDFLCRAFSTGVRNTHTGAQGHSAHHRREEHDDSFHRFSLGWAHRPLPHISCGDCQRSGASLGASSRGVKRDPGGFHWRFSQPSP
jgi:hypothetical protein